MQPDYPAPGINIAHTDDDVVIRINRQHAMPVLSVLLHSKFSDGPRVEFLTTPYVNALIEALIGPSGFTPDSLTLDQSSLDTPIRIVKEWAASNGLEAEQAKSMLGKAIYPYEAHGVA